MKEIGEAFPSEKYSTVSSAIERMKKRVSKIEHLRRRLDEMENSILKSQGKGGEFALNP